MPSAIAPRLRVGVVGAGIAGLGAAIALRRAGHDVEVRVPQEAACPPWLMLSERVS